MLQHHAPRKKNRGDEPARIVYHAGERTFARLLNESSLEGVKNVVRRKLDLEKSTAIVLKQMRSGKLLDLEDDDDFKAFETFVSRSPSTDIEIEVTVGASQSSQSREQPERAPSASESAGPSTSNSTEKQTPIPVEALTSTAMTPKRKRAVSFSDVAASEGPKSAEKPSHKKQKVREKAAKTVGPSAPSTVEPPRTEVSKSAEEPSQKKKKKKDQAKKTVGPSATTAASTSTVEPPRTELQTSTSEPVKEKRKKEKKVKEPQPAPVVELPLKTASDGPNPPGSAVPPATEREKEAETSDTVGISKPAAKKQSKQKKDDIAKKLPASVDQEGIDSLVNDSSKAVGDDSLQPASKKLTKSTGEGEAAKGQKTRKSVTKRPSKPSACASIPSTSESRRLQDEVAAAILSGLMSNASGTVRPTPAVPNKPKKKESKKLPLPPVAAQSFEPAVEPEPIPDVSNKPTANALTEAAPVPTNTPSRPLTQTSNTTGPACPICLQHPFHIRYFCPTVLKGHDAIRQRLVEELQNPDPGDQGLLVKELKALIKGISSTPSAEDAEPRESSSIPRVSIPRPPTIPSNSYLSEVTVESRDEGSSSDSSNDTSAGENKVSPVVQERFAPEEEPHATQADLDAVIRGPVSRRQSVLDLIDQVVSDEDTNNLSEEEQGELEEDQDEEVDRSRRQLTRKRAATSDSETEEESRSPSPRPSEAMDDDSPAAVEIQGEHVETLAGVEDGDVVMKDSVVDVPVPEKQVDDSGEETQVEREEAMVVDGDSLGVKAAIADKAASPTPVSNTLSSKVPASQPPESQVAPRGAADADIPPDEATPAIPVEADVDPIEFADNLESPSDLIPPNADPIEVGSPPPEVESLFSNAPHSTPKPGVAQRLKTRSGKIPDSDEHPVSLQQFASEAQALITPLFTNGRTRKQSTAIPASQEPVTTRKSARFSSVPPPTTPAAVVLLNRRKGGVKTTKAVKTPVKEIEGGLNPAQGSATSDTRVARTPSTIRWETFAEPDLSPQVDESPMQVDELISSPAVEGSMILGRPNGKAKKGRSGKTAPALSQSSQEKERLFDLTPTQVPFPYSQHRNPAPVASFDKQGSDEPTDSEEEKTLKKKPKLPARKPIITYRSLSQLASQATQFSPRLPTPVNASGSNGKARKNVADDSSSSSSGSDSDSDSDGTGGSEHIPPNRRAGLTKRRKSLLSRM